MSDSAYVVVNPASANGKTGQRWPELANMIRGRLRNFEVGFTEAPRHGVTLVREAIKAGARRIISVGGDGTHNEAVNGFFEGSSLLADDLTLSIVPTGTGGDLRRTLGLPDDPLAAIDCIGRNPIAVDLGRLECIGPNGQTTVEHFVNISSFGASGLVVSLVNASSKRLGGRVSFLVGAVKGTFKYRNQRMRITLDRGLDTERRFEGRFYNGVVANARYFGGGMMIAPHAQMDDGLFDVVLLGDLSKYEVLSGTAAIYKGRHLDRRGVDVYRARTVDAEPLDEAPVLIDLDGEQPGRLPARYSIVSAAARICTGPDLNRA